VKQELFERFLARLVERGRLDVTYASGATASFGEPAEGYPDVAIRFTDDKVPSDLLLDPRTGAGEAYMDGRLVVERGEVLDLVTLVRMNNRFERFDRLHEPGALAGLKRRLEFLHRSFNDAKSAGRNVSHHYDIGNDLYRLMLDTEHMQYSCAYWPSDDLTLEQAQTAKLAHIAAKLALSPGQRVLDIGCGWGGMAIYLARHCDVEVLGITLSKQQLALAEDRVRDAGLSGKVRLELVDYRDLAARGERFDRIVSVGMFEHVGRPQFGTFFRACANLLGGDGVMLLHTIGRMGRPGVTDTFTDKHIFPGGYIPALSETVAASERARLIATDVEILRLHYARTLREWYRRCVANREAIVAMYDERFFRMWTFYLSGSIAAFEHGGMCNYQIQYARDRRVLPMTRGYMEQAEQALLGGSLKFSP
jgi:cyclopropane-fatty-acyl-phospholipid synthase